MLVAHADQPGPLPSAPLRAVALCLAAIALLAGCSTLHSIGKSIKRINTSTMAYSELQSFIKDRLTSKFGRPVRSVSCAPHVSEVLPSSSAHLTCVVRFADGSSYTTAATITDPSTDPDYVSYKYSFYDPPSADITTHLPPAPTVTLAATSPKSLFAARNLAPAVKKLTARFGTHDLIVQMAIYPGEIEVVMAANGGKAWPASVSYTGKLAVGTEVTFSGSRSGIVFGQLHPSVIQRLTKLITTKGKEPLAQISRFVLTNSLPHDDSGWNIYLTSGSTRFQSLVLGDDLVVITASGRRALN